MKTSEKIALLGIIISLVTVYILWNNAKLSREQSLEQQKLWEIQAKLAAEQLKNTRQS